MKEASHDSSIDPELEARIVALVLGEASDFERDELNRLIQQRPELVSFEEQVRRVHELMQDVGTGELVQQDDDWKLSDEKRKIVLSAINGNALVQQTESESGKSAVQRKSGGVGFVWKLARIAAVFCVLCGIGSVLFLQSHWAKRGRSRLLVQNNARDFEHARGDRRNDDSTPSSKPSSVVKGRTAGSDDGRMWEAEPGASASLDPRSDSTAVLGSIRDTLEFDVPESTEAVIGKVPSSAVQIDSIDPVIAGGTVDGAEQPGGRSKESRPAVKNPRSGDPLLSFPHLAARPGDSSSVNVQGPEPVLLGGDRRTVEERSQSGAMGKPVDPQSLSDEMSEATSGADSQGSSNGLLTPELVDQPVLEHQSQSFGFIVVDDVETAERGSQQLLSKREDALPADQDSGIDPFAVDGESLGDPADGFGGSLGSGLGSGGFGGFGGGKATEAAKGLMWSDSSDHYSQESGGQPYGSMTRSGRANGTKVDPLFDSDFTGAYQGVVSTPSSEKGKLERDSEFDKKGAVDLYGEQDANGNTGTLGRHGVTFDDFSTPRQDAEHGLSNPLTGAAESQPDGEVSSPQAESIRGWRYAQPDHSANSPAAATPSDDALEMEERVKRSLGDISDLSELYKYADTDGDSHRDEFKNKLRIDWLKKQSGEKAEQQGRARRFENQQAITSHDRWYAKVPKTSDEGFFEYRESARKLAASTALEEKTVESEPFSTFSLHVSDVSFKLAGAALAQGEWPKPAQVRIEEFVNAFDYGDPLPSQDEKVACFLEQSIHPFLQQRNVMRVSLRTSAAGRSSSTPLRLTLLLDNSGSMERPDREQTVRRAFGTLAGQLRASDQVTLITFARRPRLLADRVSGTQSRELVQLIERLPSEGGTNIEAALQLAFEKAQEQHVDGAQNRIVLLTDGAVNLGNADPDSLSRMVATMRNTGIAFDAAGISAEGLNDEILEALTRKGDGRYYLLDSVEAADDGFARQIAGALRPSAKNVKVQLEFNPKRVSRYKLLGFEKHRLNQEDFRNDKVDAAEMAAAEAGVAMYQFEVIPDGEGDVGSISVRFRDVSTGQMIEKCWPIPYEANAPRLDQARPSLRLAACVSLFAAKLRGEPLGEAVDLQAISDLIDGLPDADRNTPRVHQLQTMIEQARQIIGN